MHCSENLQKINTIHGTAVALGYFDGVHLGHRAVIGAAVRYAKENGLCSAVFSFSLSEHGVIKGNTILCKAEKERRIQGLGTDYFICPPFEEFCSLTPSAFVNDVLHDAFGARAVFCGEDFTFGAKKAGNITTLKALCAEKGIEVFIIPTALYNGEAVSSTRIREAIGKGECELANAMLGEVYAVDLPVQKGQGLGSTLGVPTINQHYEKGMQIPKGGDYITKAYIDGKAYAAATGIGSRPTVDGEGITCESFIMDYSGNLYGKSVRVEFYKYMMPTKRFETTEELKQMINTIADAAREYFEKSK